MKVVTVFLLVTMAINEVCGQRSPVVNTRNGQVQGSRKTDSRGGFLKFNINL